MTEPENGKDGTFYRMARSHDGSGRLTLQHYLWKDQFGWSLHPTISADWQANDSLKEIRIADVACGNAIWGLEQVTCHHQGREIKVTGFDVSNAQIPPKATWPKNYNFELWNIYEAPSQEHIGQFDVVYVRLILAAIPDGNPEPILKNLTALLKPGGFLQWCETDIYSPQVTRCDYGLQIAHEVMSRYGRLTNMKWIPNLPQVLKANALENVVSVYGLPQTWMHKAW